MPKMKSHSGTKKRFRKTGTGKLMRAKAFKSHILSRPLPMPPVSATRTLPPWRG